MTEIKVWNAKYGTALKQGYAQGYGAQHHFQQYFSYIVAVSFIVGENLEKTNDLPQVTDKLKSHNVVSSTLRHQWDSNSQLQW